jgi:2-methylcitrate dehydratase PrpD
MPDQNRTAAGQLADFTVGLTLDALPADVVEAAKCKLLDAYGCGMAAVALGECTSVLRWAGAAERDGGLLVARDERDATTTALATGTLIHALDFDDTHPEALCHVTAVVGTAAVATGQALGRTGADVLTAQVAGTEAVARLGAVASGEWHLRGIHPTAACGVFGATLAAGRLMELDADTLERALGLAGSTSSGLFEYLADGSQTKPFHAGWAAHAGIVAAQLAAAGLRGPTTVIEGRFGLFGALLAQDRAADVAAQLADLGQRWETLRVSIKPYPTCHFTHAAIEAGLGLAADGIDAADVERVRLTVPAAAVPIVLEPRGPKLQPRSAYDAKFSLPYTVAAALIDGRVDLQTFSAEELGAAPILQLAARTEFVTEQRAPDLPFFTLTELQLHGGGVRRVDVPRPLGTPGRAIERAGVLEKFAANAARAIPDPQAFADRVLSLDEAPGVRDVALSVVGHLRRGATGHIVRPPSTVTTVPVRKLASSDAR